MQPYHRAYPFLSLCGLNCGLCPNHQTKAASRCPGCGGEDFHLKHPTCPIVTCSRRHGEPAFCFECADFPCERYSAENMKDSFISYRHVADDMRRVRQEGLEAYRVELDEKIALLEQLLDRYDDGRSKSFLCNAVNLLPVDVVRQVAQEMQTAGGGAADGIDAVPSPAGATRKDVAAGIRKRFEAAAAQRGISLMLRK